METVLCAAVGKASHQHGFEACTVYGDCTVCSCRHSKTSSMGLKHVLCMETVLCAPVGTARHQHVLCVVYLVSRIMLKNDKWVSNLHAQSSLIKYFRMISFWLIALTYISLTWHSQYNHGFFPFSFHTNKGNVPLRNWPAVSSKVSLTYRTPPQTPTDLPNITVHATGVVYPVRSLTVAFRTEFTLLGWYIKLKLYYISTQYDAAYVTCSDGECRIFSTVSSSSPIWNMEQTRNTYFLLFNFKWSIVANYKCLLYLMMGRVTKSV